jgi:NADH dehydrogenase FAD-containing subunit
VTAAGHELVVVSPGPFWYSGLATGVLAGLYPPELDRIDVRALVEGGGGRFIRDRVTGMDPGARRIRLEGGAPLEYDVVSVNLGSGAAGRLPGAAEHAVPVKPVEGLVAVGERVDRWMSRSGTERRAVVVGGGASGCEVAMALEARSRKGPGRLRVTLLTRGPVLPSFPPGARRSFRRIAAARGVEVEEGLPVEAVGPHGVTAADGVLRETELVVDASGLAPHPVHARLGLPVDREGALRVDAHLRSVADPRVFGAGDGVALEGHDLARVGVYAVRQAPVLHHNLLTTARAVDGALDRRSGGEGAPDLRHFEPPSRFLLILGLGDGTGLARWGPFHLAGSPPFRLKDWIDRRWLREMATPHAG